MKWFVWGQIGWTSAEQTPSSLFGADPLNPRINRSRSAAEQALLPVCPSPPTFMGATMTRSVDHVTSISEHG